MPALAHMVTAGLAAVAYPRPDALDVSARALLDGWSQVLRVSSCGIFQRVSARPVDSSRTFVSWRRGWVCGPTFSGSEQTKLTFRGTGNDLTCVSIPLMLSSLAAYLRILSVGIVWFLGEVVIGDVVIGEVDTDRQPQRNMMSLDGATCGNFCQSAEVVLPAFRVARPFGRRQAAVDDGNKGSPDFR